MNQETTFQCWAVVELFGHTQLAGKVTEQTIAGQSFLRIDIPKTTHCPAFTKYHLPTAVYGLTPVDEDYATRMADHIAANPVNSWEHHEVIAEIIREKLQDANKQLSEPAEQ